MRPARHAPLAFSLRSPIAALLFVALCFFPLRSHADTLPQAGVEELHTLIDGKHDPAPDPDALAAYRRDLRKAAADLPTLSELSRVLLLSEWSTLLLDLEAAAPLLPRVRNAVRQSNDEAFKADIRKLLPKDPIEASEVNRAIIGEIKREVQLGLLKRLEDRSRYYMRDGRDAEKIAAVNLIGNTMTSSRRQDISHFEGVRGVMVTTSRDIMPSAEFLRTRIRELMPEVRRLMHSDDPQIQIAAVRALSNMERNGKEFTDAVKPLLSPQTNVLTRRAAAMSLANMLKVNAGQLDGSQLKIYLIYVQQILPVAAVGLADEDAEVRYGSLMACEQAADILSVLSKDSEAIKGGRPAFQPTMAVVERALPAIDRIVRDRVPSLRLLACRVLERMVMTSQKIRSLSDQPAPTPPTPIPDTKPKERNDKKKNEFSRPLSPLGQRKATRASAWATLRPTAPLPSPPAPNTTSVKPVAFQAPPKDVLPHPKSVDSSVANVVATMKEALNDPDYRVRITAVDVLETLGELAEDAIPALVKALGDSNKFVRWASARTLGRLAPRRADIVVPALAGLLNDREDSSVKFTAAYALELYGPAAKEAVDHLASVINRGDKDYILAILRTIQAIGTDAARALPNVVWLLNDRTQPTSVRIEAVQTLGHFGPSAARYRELLKKIMIYDTDEAVRNAASAAVLSIDRERR
jgi:flagellar biogenesis protein FliO